MVRRSRRSRVLYLALLLTFAVLVTAASAAVLKSKVTGETLKGTLTDQAINGLRVFVLDGGGKKFLNMDDWEIVEADAPKADVPPVTPVATKAAEHVATARQLAAKRQYDEALDELNQALGLDPNDAAAKALRDDLVKKALAAHVAKARQCVAKESYVEAFNELERALALDKDNAAAKTLRDEVRKKDIDGLIPLSRIIPEFTVQEISLRQALNMLCEAAKTVGVNVIVDGSAISGAGVDLERGDKISLTVKKVSVGNVLKMICPRGVGFEPQADGTILVSDQKRLNANLPVREYDVRDLIGNDGDTAVQRLVQLIESTVKSTEPWQSLGGRASIQVFKTVFVISQTREGHRKVKELLESLRKTGGKSPSRSGP